jgi:hypothetical protein
MQLKLINRLLLLSVLVLGVGVTMSPTRAEYIKYNGETQIQYNGPQKISPVIVAGSPAVCKANYDQCMRGCGGATSCSNQCMTNYNGCLH